MKKIIVPGIVIAVATFIAGMILSYLFMLFPSYAADITNTSLMRSMQDPLMMAFFFYPLLIGLIYAWVWTKVKGLFKGSVWQRGYKFGLSLFLVVTIPGMFISYTSMPFAFITILGWLVSGLVNSLIAGCILAKMNK